VNASVGYVLFASYSAATLFYEHSAPEKHGFQLGLSAGSIAGGFQAIFGTPIDTLKVRTLPIQLTRKKS
jgi:hypothetical protein